LYHPTLESFIQTLESHLPTLESFIQTLESYHPTLESSIETFELLISKLELYELGVMGNRLTWVQDTSAAWR